MSIQAEFNKIIIGNGGLTFNNPGAISLTSIEQTNGSGDKVLLNNGSFGKVNNNNIDNNTISGSKISDNSLTTTKLSGISVSNTGNNFLNDKG